MKHYTTTGRKSPPTPTLRGGFWEVDLRPWGFGWHHRLGPASMPPIAAVHAAYAKLDELRGARIAGAGGQLELCAGAPQIFAMAMDEWERRKEYDTDAGKAYGKAYARHVRGELGAYVLGDLSGVIGGDVLLKYKAALAGLGPRTVRNRFSVLGQVLKFSAARGWLPAGLPPFPKMPRPPAPRFEWIDEATFRAVRAFTFPVHGCKPPEGETLATWTERRRCYLSWLMYTGAHPRDADTCEDRHVGLDVGVYLRHNSKSADHVPDEQFEMPEPLVDDLRQLLRVLGREAFYCGELIFGGPWANHNRVMERRRQKLGIRGVPLNARILRRSFARELLRRGHTVPEVSARMGHTDDTMVKEVYTRIPRAAGVARSRWTRDPRLAPPDPARRVLSFTPQIVEGETGVQGAPTVHSSQTYPQGAS